MFSVDHIFFTLWGYPMSYVEFFGTLLNLAAVWMVAHRNIWTWPVGIIAVILFGILFWQIQLYSDFLEQAYYLATNIFGWWLWIRRGPNTATPGTQNLQPRWMPKKGLAASLLIISVFTLLLGYAMERIHLWFPKWVTEPASYPYLDAFTTVSSFVAQLLMAYVKLESWLIWIVVDVIGVGLYYAKHVWFVALLYFVFLIIATIGFRNWYKARA